MNMRLALAPIEPGNPSTTSNGDKHTEIQQATAPTVATVSTDSKTLVMALAAFFVIIFFLSKLEKWAKKGVV